VLAREEGMWGFNTSLVVITSSHRKEWIPAVDEVHRRRVRVAVILLDNASFGGLFNTLDVVPPLYDAGIAPYVVRQGEDIPVALSHVHVMAGTERIGSAVGGAETEARL
ncbi:MAG: hypothetical protein ACRDIB_19690, partial [Ardenticatenaceae bacterium]